MDENFQKTTEQAAAFQKIWMESMSKLMQTAFTINPGSPPPEVLRQLRSGIFQALAKSWEEFMRSPQFLEGMKQWMDSAIHFRKMTNDFLGKVRNEMQAPSYQDMDGIMGAIAHMEKRLLDRIDQLDHQVAALKQSRGGPAKARPAETRRRASGPAQGRKRTAGNGKVETH
ncbi:MAG TPA: hypothetical protein VLT36_20630 [Candidatus Dormibacteraeota bacterium]|nr:hypothetical protein [Candidatus Dormibacteraeota bacterium]